MRMRMHILASMLVFIIAASTTSAVTAESDEKKATGALAIYEKSPWYFQDSKGKPLMLIGDYTWGIFSDIDYDYIRFFDSLKSRGLNQARIWLWWGCEQFEEKNDTPEHASLITHIEPYLREGPGIANDGKPKYNLDKFNPAFFARLEDLCKAAQKRGINLQLIMMDAWMIKHPHLWKIHAYNINNNVNGVDGDPARTGRGTDGKQGFCSMGNEKVFKYQKAYILKVVDTVNKFDNIYYEIANENYYNEEWELALGKAIKDYERDLPKQHLVIRHDFPSHSYVVQSWDPMVVHNKLIEMRKLRVPLLFDTDWTISENDAEVRRSAWAAVSSGGHFSLMDDDLEYRITGHTERRPERHRQIDYIARFMKKIKPWEMNPDANIVKSGKAFAMRNNRTLFAYLPYGGQVKLDLTQMEGKILARWYDPLTGKFGERIEVEKGHNSVFETPDGTDKVLLIESAH